MKDLLEAVRDGTVDAQDNSLTNIWNFRICDHHPQLTGHFFGVAAVLCHAPSFESWSGEVRAAVVDCVREATELQRRLAAAEDRAARAKLERAGARIVEPSQEERRAGCGSPADRDPARAVRRGTVRVGERFLRREPGPGRVSEFLR